MHFCVVDKIYGAVCDCAEGYRLDLDGRTCEPTGTIILFPLIACHLSALSQDVHCISIS